MHKNIVCWAACVLVAGSASVQASTAEQGQGATGDSLAARAPMSAIAPQPLKDALILFGRATGLQLIYESDFVLGQRTRGAPAGLAPAQVLERLLQGTGLTYQVLNERTISIHSASKPVAASSQAGEMRLVESGGQQSGAQGRASDGSAAVRPGGDRARAQEDGESNDGKQTISEIVVTAQKREERLQDVPIPVTAVKGETLIDNSQLRIQDYYTRIPGLSVMAGEGGSYAGLPKLVIRGITTGGFSRSTVGITVDDVPYGQATNQFAPDIDPNDLARIEVLRGPQGTLYGASSMGGLFKFVTMDPSMERFSGRVQAGMTSIRNGNEMGYNVRGAVNIPLGETVAMRATAFTRRDPGYIDDPGLGVEGVNRGRADGGRLSALWRPSENFSLKLSALLQDIEQDGSSFVHVQPGLGELEQSAVRGTGGYSRKTQAYSALMNAKLGRVDITAVSGYNVDKLFNSLDFTPNLGGAAQAIYGVDGAFFLEGGKTSKFSQELRFSLGLGSRVDWLFGAFYSHETSPYRWDLPAADPAIGIPVGSLGQLNSPTSFEEYAAFTDFTFHITDRFDLQVGGRQAYDHQVSEPAVSSGALFGGTSVGPRQTAREHAFTYLVTPRFKISPSAMAYARFASGFRPGGHNSENPLSAFVIPTQYEPDKTQNYELGIKGDLMQRMFSFDASLYYIDWKDIQLQLYIPGYTYAYTTNGSRAKSQGVELAFEARPLRGLTLAATVSRNEAVLTEDFPSNSTVFGLSGNRLPYSSRLSGNLSVDQEFPLFDGALGYVGGSVSYVGDREGVFIPGSSERQLFPAYAQTDLRAGVKYNAWAVNLFVNNVADKRVYTAGGIGAIFPFAFTVLQPRTAGLSVTRTF